MKTIPFSEARAHLAETLQRVLESRDPLLISRRGKGGAVLVSVDTWDAVASSPAAGFAEALRDWRAQYTVEPAESADGEFEDLRDRQERSGRSLPFVDGQIAAIAIANGLTLATRNRKDFEGLAGMRVADWFG